jgi:hypothetical protein
MRKVIFVIALFALAVPLLAEDQPGSNRGVPVSYQWSVTPCETWSCAYSALTYAGGDPYVMAVPTNSTRYAWVVLRRLEAGSYYVPPDAPFQLEAFDGMDACAARFGAIDGTYAPLVITTPDRMKLVVYLSRAEAPARTRAAAH